MNFVLYAYQLSLELAPVRELSTANLLEKPYYSTGHMARQYAGFGIARTGWNNEYKILCPYEPYLYSLPRSIPLTCGIKLINGGLNMMRRGRVFRLVGAHRSAQGKGLLNRIKTNHS